MALPYTTPPNSHPGTPLSSSRPGTPSKLTRGFGSLMSNMAQLQEGNHFSAVREKQHLSNSRQHLPRLLRPLGPYLSTFTIPIPFNGKSFLLPVPCLFVFVPKQTSLAQSRNKEISRGINRKPFRLRLTPLGTIALILLVIFLITEIKRHSHRMKIPFVLSSTNILTNEQIARVWQWEVGEGHYPSSRRTPTSINLAGVQNPGVDANAWNLKSSLKSLKQVPLSKGPSRFPPGFSAPEGLHPNGPKRKYYNISSSYLQNAMSFSPFPRRPPPNSIIDLDVIMDYCDFTTNKYVRDCLEVLRTGAGLNNQHHFRRGSMEEWRHIYLEEGEQRLFREIEDANKIPADGQDILEQLGYYQKDPHALTPSEAKAHQLAMLGDTPPSAEAARYSHDTPNLLQRQNMIGFGSSARPHPTHPSADPTCDPDYPRIFHVFWAGAFTDKPYLAVISFLYTQNLALHLDPNSNDMKDFLQKTCRPQLWVWINTGPAASLPNPRARSQMFDQLRNNPWSSPFLHERFSQTVKFKMWNTTEQLDNIPELRTYWRSLPLFNSGGVKYGTPAQSSDAEDEISEVNVAESRTEAEGVTPEHEMEELGRFGEDAMGTGAKDIDKALAIKGEALNATARPDSVKKHIPSITSPSKLKKKDDEMLKRVGSTSSKGYDRLTVVLSDMARFVLTHRFGGIYLDADTIFLRDWEELWGWKGAFAYRWSRLEKYNTAVLKMHRNSAIGSFLFKSALANGLDFHPMTISKYARDASLEGLLLRLPDALFDSAWLNTEYYQRDRPAYPYFKRFEDFFDPPKEDSAAPLALGFEGFFRGAFSYHFHNFWRVPFDPARNWPDLGERFAAGEREARAKAVQVKIAVEQAEGTQVLLNRSPTRPPAETLKSRFAGPTGSEQINRGSLKTSQFIDVDSIRIDSDDVKDDTRDLGWATVLKRTFEAYLRNEQPNMYGEYIKF